VGRTEADRVVEEREEGQGGSGEGKKPKLFKGLKNSFLFLIFK
jgi:hypothetical protein